MLAYLVDIFTMLKDLNMLMQGKNFNCFGQSKKKILSSKKELLFTKQK